MSPERGDEMSHSPCDPENAASSVRRSLSRAKIGQEKIVGFGPATYAELEEFKRRMQRSQLATIGVLGTITVASVLALLVVVLRPTPVIAFDSVGKALIFKDTVGPGLHTDIVRVKHFAREFINKYVGVDGLRLKEDFRDATNMMTPRLQELMLKEGSEIEYRKRFAGSSVRSYFPEIEFSIEDFDPAEHQSDIHLVAWGTQEYNDIYGQSEPVKEYVFIKMVLRREVVREVSPYGLLVKFVEYEHFKERRKLDAARLKNHEGELRCSYYFSRLLRLQRPSARWMTMGIARTSRCFTRCPRTILWST